MASLIGGMSWTEGEVERSRSAQGLLENSNGSEVMVFNERDFRAEPANASASKQTTDSPRKVLTPLPKHHDIQEQIRRLTTSPSAEAFITNRQESRPPTGGVHPVSIGPTSPDHSVIREGRTSPPPGLGGSMEPGSTGAVTDRRTVDQIP